uniref:Uncharacterized protein n=1 Tax=Glossina brevipalpis TaxID=37001 RepID=A0A1A9WEZ0_9MUSC
MSKLSTTKPERVVSYVTQSCYAEKPLRYAFSVCWMEFIIIYKSITNNETIATKAAIIITDLFFE